MSNTNWGIRIWRILAPLLLYYAALSAGTWLCGDADASMQVTVSALICLPLLTFWYVRDHQGLHPAVEKTVPSRLTWAAYGLVCLLAGAALSALSAFLMRRLGIYARFSNETQEAYQTSAEVWMFLGPGLLGPVCEELVYRGLAYQRLCREIPTAAAAAATSLIFAAGHGNMIQFLYALPMGLLLCAVSRCRPPLTGQTNRGWQNVFLPVMMHVGANLYSVVFTLLKVRGG